MINVNDVEDQIKRYGLTNDVKVLNAIDDYARGLINAKELYDYVNKRKAEIEIQSNNVENLDDLLEEKLEREYKKFCDSLKDKSPEEIIDRAYEITVKEEMKEMLKTMNIADKEKAIMINQDNLLNEFYHDWLDVDIPLGDVLVDSLENSISMVTRYYGKQNPFRVQKGR